MLQLFMNEYITKDVLKDVVKELNKGFKGWQTTFCQKCGLDLPGYGIYCVQCNRDENIKEILK